VLYLVQYGTLPWTQKILLLLLLLLTSKGQQRKQQPAMLLLQLRPQQLLHRSQGQTWWCVLLQHPAQNLSWQPHAHS
jgi:hypothetical protein